MRILLQRVQSAQVVVDNSTVSSVQHGALLLVGFGSDDTESDTERLAKKVVNFRIFDDGLGRMNLNILQVHGEILSVPQFTLYANLKRGNRPGFDESAEPHTAKKLWKYFNALLRQKGVTVAEGVFGVHMEIGLVNDGPVTFLLE